ncbi:MAG: efflux RND transporter permease subunit, partial [SAR324 cluster bacterium]|nr:efflux RND transporter permease subunit [SAR324 cluster bacterium]
VVLENIDKWRSRGVPLYESVINATREVYGAVLASSLTTVAVFLPVVFVQDQAGQLFKDIAIAICVAILLSFAVSTTLIPSVYRFLFGFAAEHGETTHSVNFLTRKLSALGTRGVEQMLAGLRWLQRGFLRKLAVVAGSIGLAIYIAFSLTPKLEYLPSGNRNLLLSILFPPPGYSPEETESMGQDIIDNLWPTMRGEVEGIPKIKRVFFVGFGTTLILGVISDDPQRVKELIPHINGVLARVPGMFFVTSQTSLFERGLGAGRSIDLEIYGNDINQIGEIAAQLFPKAREVLPGAQVRPIPSFDFSKPELRITPNIERAAQAGLSMRDLGMIVDVYTDGRKITEFTMPDGESLDLRLLSGNGRLRNVQDFSDQPLLAPNNKYVSLGSVAQIIETVGPVQINRINEGRVFTLRVSPPSNISLEEALEIMHSQLVVPAQKEFANVPGLRIALSGTADAFTKTRKSLQTGFILAIAITFLLLVILFEDLLSPFVIMAMLPIASAGGLIGLWFINTFVATQALDMLTMLGFMMMIGIVVNNPILIVAMALGLIRNEGKPLEEAVLTAVQARVRPIFMTTLTSVGGLLPLVLMPGAGSELYRGLGSAVLGGLVLSTVVNMIFVPCLFSLIQDIMRIFKPRSYDDGIKDTVPEIARSV